MTQRLIRVKEVQYLTGLSRATIYKFMAKRQFPQAVQLGARAIGWEMEEVESWILSRIALRDEKQAKKNEGTTNE